jgi:hypothetical protein
MQTTNKQQNADRSYKQYDRTDLNRTKEEPVNRRPAKPQNNKQKIGLRKQQNKEEQTAQATYNKTHGSTAG